MAPFLHTGLCISDSLKSVRKSVLIYETIIEGIAAAKARGVKFGRPCKPLPEKFFTMLERWEKGEISGVAAAKECGMSPTTFRRNAKRQVQNNLLNKP